MLKALPVVILCLFCSLTAKAVTLEELHQLQTFEQEYLGFPQSSNSGSFSIVAVNVTLRRALLGLLPAPQQLPSQLKLRLSPESQHPSIVLEELRRAVKEASIPELSATILNAHKLEVQQKPVSVGRRFFKRIAVVGVGGPKSQDPVTYHRQFVNQLDRSPKEAIQNLASSAQEFLRQLADEKIESLDLPHALGLSGVQWTSSYLFVMRYFPNKKEIHSIVVSIAQEKLSTLESNFGTNTAAPWAPYLVSNQADQFQAADTTKAILNELRQTYKANERLVEVLRGEMLGQMLMNQHIETYPAKRVTCREVFFQ